MKRQQCFGVTEDMPVSSPMPVIGIYISAATLVCLVLLLCDVFQGFRHKKFWFPCRFFTLNSLSLTLLGVAAKIPLDLTTSMPGAIDQLSKLCGPLIIIISMVFFIPSLVDMVGFNLFGNMAALTILVVTVIVNLSIQMATGVVSSFFFAEHVIVMILMLLSLALAWHISFVKNLVVWRMNKHRKQTLQQVHSDTIQWLRSIWTFSYLNNPQLYIFAELNYSAFSCILSLISISVLLEGCARVFFVKHIEPCEGESDYRWSMWLVVVTQIVTLALGTVSVTLRSLLIPLRCKLSPKVSDLKTFQVEARLESTWRFHFLSLNFYKLCITKIFDAIEEFVFILFFSMEYLLFWAEKSVVFSSWSMRKSFAWVTGYTMEDISLSNYLKSQATKDVERLIKNCGKEPVDHLIAILSDSKPSPEFDLNPGGKQCLFLVFLVRIATIVIPSIVSDSLSHALDDVFEMIYFIGEFLPHGGFNKNLARELWMTKDQCGHQLQELFFQPFQKKYPRIPKSTQNTPLFTQANLNSAKEVMDEFEQLLRRFEIIEISEKEMPLLRMVFERTTNESAAEVTNRIKQLFIDMVYSSLMYLPETMEKYVMQASASDQEDRVKWALKFMCKFEMLKPHVKWLSTSGRIPLSEENSFLSVESSDPGIVQQGELQDNETIYVLVD